MDFPNQKATRLTSLSVTRVRSGAVEADSDLHRALQEAAASSLPGCGSWQLHSTSQPPGPPLVTTLVQFLFLKAPF